MAYCTVCGTLAKPGAMFCSSCGRPLHSVRAAQGGVPENSAEIDQRSAKLEALEIGAEVLDTEAFLAVCHTRPDEALRKISTLEIGMPELGRAFPVPLYKFLALARSAMIAYESSGNQLDNRVSSLCSECLRAFARAKTAAKAADAEDLIKDSDVTESLDAIAILAETDSPGRVQQELAETKLKYAAFANRVDIAKVVQSALTNDEMREALEFPVTAPFIIRAALFGPLTDVGDAKVLSIMLFEQTDVWAQSDRMNPIKGQVHLRKEKKLGSQWTLLSAPQ